MTISKGLITPLEPIEIYYIGAETISGEALKKNFNFENLDLTDFRKKGFEELIKRLNKINSMTYPFVKKGESAEIGQALYRAGEDWINGFDYERALDALKKSGNIYYQKAKLMWPLGIKQSKEVMDLIKSNSKKLETKKLKLESAIQNLKEEWFDTFKLPVRDRYTGEGEENIVEIFVNPTQKEFLDCSKKIDGEKHVRGIADSDTKKLYIFSPHYMHKSVYDRLIRKGVHIGQDHLRLMVRLVNSEWELYYPENEEVADDKKIWGWLKNYNIKIPTRRTIKDRMNEEFSISFKPPKNTNFSSSEVVEVFKNPASNEYKEVSAKIGRDDYVRFIAGTNKELYIFSPSVFHEIVWENLGKKEELNAPVALWGVAKKTPKGWLIVSSDTNYNKMIKPWEWLNNYGMIILELPKWNAKDNEKYFPDQFNEEVLNKIKAYYPTSVMEKTK